MKTQPGKNGGTLVRLEPGETNNPGGRPKGSRNRTTLMKWVCAQDAKSILSKKTYALLKEKFPGLDQMSAEEVMHLRQIVKAIEKGDTFAYNSVLDAAYGKAKQALEHTGENGGPIQYQSYSHLTDEELTARIAELSRGDASAE